MCFALYVLGTEVCSVDEAWLVKRKEQPLYWVLNELLTNIHLSITQPRSRALAQQNLIFRVSAWEQG